MLTQIDNTNIKSTGVVAGRYTDATIIVNEQGQILSASSGLGGGGTGNHITVTTYDSVNSEYRPGTWVISTNIHSNETVNVGVTFSPDGVYMYTSGDTSDAIDQYTLSTPYDVSTAVYTRTRAIGTGFTYSTTQPRGITFDPTGVYMFVGDDLNNRVLRFDLSTAWDISTISTTNTMVSISTQTAAPGYGLQFSSDGLLMFINNQTSNIFTYSLTTPWTISSGVTYVRVLTTAANSRGFIFSSDGLQLFALTSSGVVTRRTLTTAWDTSTAAAVNQTITISSSNFPTATYGTPVYSIYLNESITGLSAGKRLYMSLPGVSTSEYIGQFELSAPNDISFLCSPLFNLPVELSQNITLNPGTAPVYIARLGTPSTDMSKRLRFSVATVLIHNNSYLKTPTSANYTVNTDQIFELTYANGSWSVTDIDNSPIKTSLLNLPSQAAGLVTANGTTLTNRVLSAGSGVSITNTSGGGTIGITNTGVREVNQRSDTANVNVWWRPTKFTRYGNDDGGAGSPWTNRGDTGTYHISQLNGGWNGTDTPEIYLWNKNWEMNHGSDYEGISYPRGNNALNPANFFKRYYYYDGSWTQRERIFLGQTNWRTNARAVRTVTELCWGGEFWGNWNMYSESESTPADEYSYNYGVPYAGDGSQAPTGTNVSGTWLQSGTSTAPTVLSFSVTTTSIIDVHMSGRRIHFTCWTADGAVERNRTDTGGVYRETFTFSAATTFYYMYWAIGDNPDRCFVKVFHSNTATTYWTFKYGGDMGGTEWRYYIPSSQRDNFRGGGWPQDFTDRQTRYWSTKTLALPATTNSVTRGFTIRCNFRVDDITLQDQNILWIANSAAPGNVNGMRIRVNEGSVDRRLSITLATTGNASGTGNIINTLKCWQYNGNGETVEVAFVWNPLDTTWPGRLYVQEALAFKTASNPFGSSTTWFNIGSTASGTANGFLGFFEYLEVVPEVRGAHIPQGTITIDVDAGNTGWVSTNNNGGQEVAVSTRNAIGCRQYLRGTSWGIGAEITGGISGISNEEDVCNGALPGGTVESFTITGDTVSGSKTITFSKSTAGFQRNPGRFLVTGSGIPTTTNVYTSVGYGDKTFNITIASGDVFATATATNVTFTFVRCGIVPGYWFLGGGYARLAMPGNALYVAKSNAVSATLTMEMAGVHSGGTTSTCVFPDITFTVNADTGINNYYTTSNSAANDTAVRGLMAALARGKTYTITGSGISTTSATIDNAMINGANWDDQGRGLHRIYLTRDRNSAVTGGSTMTARFVRSWSSSLEDWEKQFQAWNSNTIDYSGLELRGYSPNNWWGSSLKQSNTMAVTCGVGRWNYARVAPPGGVYDSGVFRATSTTFTKKMYLSYGCVGYLINYGTTGDYNQSTVNPVVSTISWAASNGMNSDGFSLTVVANTYYRVVILPLGTSLTATWVG